MHNLYRDEHSSSEGSDNDTWKNAYPVDSKKQASQDNHSSDSEDSISIASNDTREDNEEDPILELVLAAFASHENKPQLDRKALACLRRMLSGKCDNLDCPFGHRTDILLKGAQEMIGKLTAFVNSHKGTAKDNDGAVPYKILHKEKFGKA